MVILINGVQIPRQILHPIRLLQQAHWLIGKKEQYFGIANLGANMEGGVMHQKLLEAYGKAWK